MSGTEEQRATPPGREGDDVPAVVAAHTRPKASIAAHPNTALTVHDDAKKFATILQAEILTRMEQQSANLDKLFDAESLK